MNIAKLIAQGILLPYRCFVPPIPTLGGFNEAFARAAADRARDKATLVFCSSMDHARDCADVLNSIGITAEVLSGNMSIRQRRYAIDRYETGETRALCGVHGLLDVQHADVCILMYPTDVRSLYQLQCAKALQPRQGKTEGIIIDMVGNVLRHGMPDDESN